MPDLGEHFHQLPHIQVISGIGAHEGKPSYGQAGNERHQNGIFYIFLGTTVH